MTISDSATNLDDNSGYVFGSVSKDANADPYLDEEVYTAKYLSDRDARIADNKNDDTLLDSLILYLPFNESTNSRIFADKSGQGNSASCASSSECPISGISGHRGNSVNFINHNQIVTISDDSSLHSDRDLTISVWIYPGALEAEAGVIVSKINGNVDCPASGGNCSDREYFLSINQTGRIQFQLTPIGRIGIGSVNCQTSAGAVPFGQWSHIVARASADPQEMKVFVNGNVAMTCKQPALSSGIRTSDGQVSIGRMTKTSWGAFDLPFNGRIDELRIYNRAISESEVKALGKF